MGSKLPPVSLDAAFGLLGSSSVEAFLWCDYRDGGKGGFLQEEIFLGTQGGGWFPSFEM